MRSRYLDLDDRTQDLAERIRDYPDIAQDFLQKYELSWIYHENALEGVVYTLQELTTALDASPVADVTVVGALQEVRNHKTAIEIIRSEARAKKPRITATLVKRLHETLNAGIQSRGPSEYRKDMPLHRAYFHEIADPAKIPNLLAKLLESTDTAEFRQSHPLHQASRVQHGFMQVFPYTDGSGRVARLLANLLLLHRGYLPCIVHSVDRQRYYESLRAPEPVLRDLMLEAMENALANGERFFADVMAARAKRAAR
ncbi:MAG TPA: Fic family protein [Anaeromyxobacteraceae bacterium]|nr:Fic family protein [Anaeromyxobacteraceae bacterium]